MSTIFLILLISIVVLVLFYLPRALLFLVEVEGWSMYPTYHNGDRLLALRSWPSRWLRRGHIVVWKLPSDLSKSIPEIMGSRLFIKRIVGLPGDEVIAPILKLPDPAKGEKQIIQESQELGMRFIPPGHCFVKGDSSGFDSTQFGPLPLNALRGVVLVKLPHFIRAPSEYEIPADPPLLTHSPQKNP